MNKILGIFAALLVVTCIVAGCGTDKSADKAADGKTVLKVGASAVPHAEILEEAKPILAKEGVDLEIVPFNDYVQPNMALHDKELDANFFQHKPYLDEFNKQHNFDLVNVGGVHIEPMGIYSKKIHDLNALPDGATVAIPNDPTNGGRALLLLQKNGIIKLKDPTALTATVNDIVDNPKHIKIKEVEAAQLPRTLDDVDVAVINTNYAIQANLNPTKDALAIEDSTSPYVNIIVTRQDNKDNPAIQKLLKVLHSEEMKKFVDDKYKGAILPAK